MPFGRPVLPEPHNAFNQRIDFRHWQRQTCLEPKVGTAPSTVPIQGSTFWYTRIPHPWQYACRFSHDLILVFIMIFVPSDTKLLQKELPENYFLWFLRGFTPSKSPGKDIFRELHMNFETFFKIIISEYVFVSNNCLCQIFVWPFESFGNSFWANWT